jgi:hypothetical protein
MLEIMWGAIGLSCGVIGSTVYDTVKTLWNEKQGKTLGRLVVGDLGGLDSTPPKMRFCVHSAINGRFLEIATYKYNPNGPDWSSEFYLLGQEDKLNEAIAKVMLMKGLEK